MRNVKGIAVPVLLCIVGPISAQERTKHAQPKYVVAPPESILITAASQRDCPIQIEDGQLLVPLDHNLQPIYRYKIRNAANKAIRSVAVWLLTSNGLGAGPLHTNGRPLRRPLLPGDSLSQPDGQGEVVIVELTQELRRKLKLDGPMRLIAVLLVEQVEFSDGSRFLNRKTTDAVMEYFTFINSREINSRADPLPW